MPLIPTLRRQSHIVLRDQSTEQVPVQACLGSEGGRKQKARDNEIEQGGHAPSPASSRTLPLRPGFRFRNRRDYLDNRCWLAGIKKLAVINKRPASLR